MLTWREETKKVPVKMEEKRRNGDSKGQKEAIGIGYWQAPACPSESLVLSAGSSRTLYQLGFTYLEGSPSIATWNDDLLASFAGVDKEPWDLQPPFQAQLASFAIKPTSQLVGNSTRSFSILDRPRPFRRSALLAAHHSSCAEFLALLLVLGTVPSNRWICVSYVSSPMTIRGSLILQRIYLHIFNIHCATSSG